LRTLAGIHSSQRRGQRSGDPELPVVSTADVGPEVSWAGQEEEKKNATGHINLVSSKR